MTKVIKSVSLQIRMAAALREQFLKLAAQRHVSAGEVIRGFMAHQAERWEMENERMKWLQENPMTDAAIAKLPAQEQASIRETLRILKRYKDAEKAKKNRS